MEQVAFGRVSRFVLTPTARRDLKSIWVYIAEDSVKHADLVEDAIFATCRLAADMPQLGHQRAGVKPELRFLSVAAYEKYMILFQMGSRPLRVLRVLHGARDIERMFPS